MLLDEADEVGGIGQIAVVHEEARLVLVRIDVEIVDAGGVERGGAPLDAVDDIAFLQQQTRQIGAVLPGDAGDQCNFGAH